MLLKHLMDTNKSFNSILSSSVRNYTFGKTMKSKGVANVIVACSF
jgi:hypothetical protein